MIYVHRIDRLSIARPLALLLLFLASMEQAVGADRFLERVSSETRDGRLVVSIHFTRRLEYLSHSPADYGERLEIRLRRPGRAAQLPGLNTAGGLPQLTPEQLPQIRTVTAQGDLDADPAVSIQFDRARRFEVRAGRTLRTIDILLAPDADADAAPVDELPPAEEPQIPQGESVAERQLADLFRQARRALNAGQYQRTTAIYDKIIASGIEPYVREAIVALGVVRAERGQDAQARAQFERYLKDYPQGPETRRVTRLLESLLQRGETSEGEETAGVDGETAPEWQVFGSFDQFYLLDHAKLDGRDSKTYRSGLLSTTNLNFQGRAGGVDVSGRFLGGNEYSFLSDHSSPTSVSYAYLDLADVDGRHQGRIGRQRLPGSGVLGYFDGLQYQFNFNESQAVRYVFGSPMRSTRDGVDTDRHFNGLALDFNGVDDRWFLSVYGFYQSFDGRIDRRAIGAEGRYQGDRITAYSLLDYDTYFDKLNIFYLFSTWRIREGTVASLTLDHRRSPGLAVSNALYTFGLDSYSELDPALSNNDIKQLAKDRSLIYRSLYTSLTQQLDERWQLSLDAGVYSLRDDSDAVSDLYGDSADSDDWYLYGQLIGNGLFSPGDLFSAGLRYTDGENVNITSVQLRTRIPVDDKLRLNPRLRLDLLDRDDGNKQYRALPSLFATYRLNRQTSLELDVGVEFSRTEHDFGGDLDDRFLYLRAGYRRDF